MILLLMFLTMEAVVDFLMLKLWQRGYLCKTYAREVFLSRHFQIRNSHRTYGHQGHRSRRYNKDSQPQRLLLLLFEKHNQHNIKIGTSAGAENSPFFVYKKWSL